MTSGSSKHPETGRRISAQSICSVLACLLTVEEQLQVAEKKAATAAVKVRS
jgi:hypothetical protein